MQLLRLLPGVPENNQNNVLRPKFGQTHIPAIPQPLRDVFQAVPKTELHMHLSGSAPIELIQDFLREQEVPEKDIQQQTVLADRYSDLDDFLATYYKVPAVIKTSSRSL